MKGKMEEAAPAKRVTVAPLQGEMTTEEERENNGEFNMAPRGSFNHLIESSACLGFPPSSFAPRLLVPFSFRRIPSEGLTIT